MGSDQLIELLSMVCYKLLPIAGLVLLIFLIVFVRHLIITMKSLTKTLDITNEQVRKLDAPLETVNDLSQTVDKLHNASKGAIGKGIEIAKNSYETVKEKRKTKKNNAEEEAEDNVDGK